MKKEILKTGFEAHRYENVHSKIHSENYTEKDAGALNLKVKSNNAEELIFSVEGKLVHKLDDSMKLSASISVAYDAINEQASIQSSFVGDGAVFKTKSIDPDPLITRAGLGLQIYAILAFSNNLLCHYRSQSACRA